MAIRTLSVRVPEDMFEASNQIARKRKISFNLLVQESLQKLIAEEQDREMYEAATLLGSDAELCDIEYAIPAQAEVALSNES